MPCFLSFDVGSCLTDTPTDVVASFFGGPMDGLEFFMKKVPKLFFVFPLDALMSGYRLFASSKYRNGWESLKYDNPLGRYENRSISVIKFKTTATLSAWVWAQNPDFVVPLQDVPENLYQRALAIHQTILGEDAVFVDRKHTVSFIQERENSKDVSALAPEEVEQLRQEKETMAAAETLVRQGEFSDALRGMLRPLHTIRFTSRSLDHRLLAERVLRAIYSKDECHVASLEETGEKLAAIEEKIRRRLWHELSNDDDQFVQNIWNYASSFLGKAQELRARCERIQEAIEAQDADVLDDKDEDAENEWNVS